MSVFLDIWKEIVSLCGRDSVQNKRYKFFDRSEVGARFEKTQTLRSKTSPYPKKAAVKAAFLILNCREVWSGLEPLGAGGIRKAKVMAFLRRQVKFC